MRLFVGLDLPVDVVARMGAAIDLLRPVAPDLRWSPVENLHITTKFIGPWPEERLDELTAALSQIRAQPFVVKIGGLGWFPNARSPRIFWVGVNGGEALRALAATTDAATSELGVARDEHSYRPHLTLARIPDDADARPLQIAALHLSDAEWGSFEIRSFFLYQSKTTPAGSVYTKLAEVALIG